MRSVLLLLLFCPLLAQAQVVAGGKVPCGQRQVKGNAGELPNPALFYSGVIVWADAGQVKHASQNGCMDFEKAISMQADAVFELASVSKQFTAMIIMMLQEKGLLKYDDLVSRYLRIPYKDITIRHLLTHTSGLPDYQAIMDAHWDKSKVAGNPEILRYLRKYAPPVLFAPGEKYEYSNTGYVLLASIAEKVTNKDFIALCREWIFLPLGMNDTDIRTPAEKQLLSRMTRGHIYVPSRGGYMPADSFASSNYTIWLGRRKGPGRISSTATDLLAWDQALYTDRLVSAATLGEAFSPMQLNDGTFSNYGFGWDLTQDSIAGRIVSHNGDNPGYKTIIVRFIDRKQTLILLCNNASMQFDTILQTMQERIIKNVIRSRQY